nr:copia protein [Tanacetum cinerariifolium]
MKPFMCKQMMNSLKKELKHTEADDQAIQTILLGLPEDIYAAEKKAKLFNEWERFTSNDEESIESYYHQWSRHVTIVHQTKDLHTTYYTQLYDFLKYNHKEVDELKVERLEKTQDPLTLMANSNNPYAFLAPHQDQPSFNQSYTQQPMPNPEDITDLTTAMNMVLALIAKAFKLNYSTPTNNNQRISSNPRNRQIPQESENANQNGNGNLVAARAKGNATGHNAKIQLQAKEFDLMAATADLDEIEEVNANCILMANLQQELTSGTQTDKALVYDSDGSAEVHDYENCYDNEMFNMFTLEEQYTELLKPIPESHQVPQNDNNVISKVTSVEQSREIVEQHPANVEETCALYDSLYQNLAIEVEKVNTVNLKLKETNAELTTELARFKNQEKCFEISLEKYDKLERCYQKSVYQEQCLSKKINVLYISFAKFVGDFKSLAKEADESLAKHKALELEIKCLLRAVVSQDIMSVVQKAYVIDTSNLQTELERTKERFENYIIKKENEYAKLWNDCETLALSKTVTSNLTPIPQESNAVKNDKVIALGMFRINPFKTSREEKHVPNTVRASARTKPITISQSPVFTKKDVNSNSNGLSSIGIDNTKTRRPQPKSNTKNDRVPSTSTSSCNKNIGVEVEEHHRNLLLSKNKKHMSSACNNIRLDSQNVISKVVYAMCKVYFGEGLGHNLFSVGQFCDSDLEVAFRRNTCFVKNLEGFDLLKGNHTTNYYTINLHDMASTSPICLMARASFSKSWLWHQRLSHLNFDTINDLAKNDLVSGLPKFKYHKEHLCLACTIDSTLFIRRFQDDILVVQVYVDDIIFGSTHPRPDIVHATCLCARYQAKPTEKHLKDIKRIFCYLRGTVNMGLWYSKDSGFELTGFSDADYAGCKDTFKSTSGGAQFLGEKLVSWSSKKQDCTTLSTAEAEYVSLSTCSQVLWMRIQLTNYGFHFNKIPIYCDSKSAIVISCNPVQQSRTKHIDVRYHFIKEHVEKGTIELYFVKTDYQLADLFTKALLADRFNYLVRRLGIRS